MNPSRRSLRYHAQPLAYRCHSMFALFAVDYLSIVEGPAHRFDEPDSPASTFRALNDFFRKLQDYATILRLNGEMEDTVPDSMLLPLIERARTADTLEADPRLSTYGKIVLTQHAKTWGPPVHR